MKPDLTRLLEDGRGVLTRADHPALEHRLDQAVKSGALVPVFAGVYTRPDFAHDFGVRAVALLRADPTAVLTGESARYVHDPRRPVPATVTATTTRLRPRAGYSFERRPVPECLTQTRHGLRVTSPALTAVDLALPLGASLDDALRARIPLEDLWEASLLTPHRRGNAERRRLLVDSRDQPWSHAERLAHRALRTAQVTGWSTNHKVRLGPDRVAFIDVAFSAIKLAIEIDGWEHHSSREAFIHDRRRDRDLAAQDWHVVRFTATEVLDDPEGFVQAVRTLVAARAQRFV
jgi:very-short-patch-repair endonuclease